MKNIVSADIRIRRTSIKISYIPIRINMVSQSDLNTLHRIFNVIAGTIYAIALIIKALVLFFLPDAYRQLKDLKGQKVLITGAGGGLGRQLALKLAEHKTTLVLWDINQEGLQETVKQVKNLGVEVHSFVCDLCKAEDVYKTAETTKKQVGEIDILINNAGYLSGGYLLDTPDHLIRRTMDVNVIAHFWTVKAFLPSMMARNKGHIVSIASLAGYNGVSKLVDYCASKFGAVGFDEALRAEIQAQGYTGIKTTCVCPYFIQATGMFGHVKTRLFSTLTTTQVADRVVSGIRREENTVIIPGHFLISIVFKLLVPAAVNDLLGKALITDAVPYEDTPAGREKKPQAASLKSD